MEDLKKKREDLEKKYLRMMDAHTKKGYVASEGAHYAEAMAIKAVYEELYAVALELQDPVPMWVG